MNDQAHDIGTHGEYSIKRWDGTMVTAKSERVAEEVPVALMYAGLPHVVMMATPADLEDFALGFSLSEGIVRAAEELLSIEVLAMGEGIQLRMDIPLERYLPLEQQRRNLAGRSSCGLCGTETIDQAVRHPARVGSGVRIAPAALQRAFAELAQRQPLNAATGGVHAAAWASPGGEVLLVREDVGRHNALDKLIGALIRAGHPVEAGFAVITSRASFEMAQKAATAGITLLAAISAPTGLAIRLAEETALTLVGFAREGRYNVYANSARIALDAGHSG